MTRTELAIQLLKVAIGLALGAYFVWWSLEVLDRLTPEEEAPREPVTLRQGARGYSKAAGSPGHKFVGHDDGFLCEDGRAKPHGRPLPPLICGAWRASPDELLS